MQGLQFQRTLSANPLATVALTWLATEGPKLEQLCTQCRNCIGIGKFKLTDAEEATSDQVSEFLEHADKFLDAYEDLLIAARGFSRMKGFATGGSGQSSTSSGIKKEP